MSELGHKRYVGSDGKRIAPFSVVEDRNHNPFVFLDEVKDIPGHCIVCSFAGVVIPLATTSEYKAKHPAPEDKP